MMSDDVKADDDTGSTLIPRLHVQAWISPVDKVTLCINFAYIKAVNMLGVLPAKSIVYAYQLLSMSIIATIDSLL